jgi:NAD(P)-dependent dehydrogenase (short-subunit alcohol dehydrogenase family)
MPLGLKSVMVTGAGSGLGRTVALALAGHGATVSCLDIDPAKLDETVSAIKSAGGRAHAVKADVADPKALAAALSRVAELEPELDGLVTCAGVQNKTSILELTAEEWDRVMAINLRGTFLSVQGALRIMMTRNKGRIVTIGSDTGKRGGGRVGKSAYGSSKGGVVIFTRSIAKELAPTFQGNIRINCVCPGPMLTPMSGDIYYNDAPKTHASVPMGRYGTTDEITAGIIFLLSDEASFVYGETMVIDGGLVMD